MSGRMTNVCISNVPGPLVPVYMNGAKAIKQMALGPLADRMGLFITVSSYNGSLTFGVTSCRRTLPDINFFMESIRLSFEELADATKKHNQNNNTRSRKTTNKTSKKPAKKISKKVSKKKSSKKKTT